MKCFNLVLPRFFGLWLAFTVAGATVIEAALSEGISFTVDHPAQIELFSLTPETRVAEVLRSRLDLFPLSQVPKLAEHIATLCRKYRFDPAFILSLIQVESAFHVHAISPVGALGLMQVMPTTALAVARELAMPWREKLGRKVGLHPVMRAIMDPFVNTEIGIAYLAKLREHYQGLSPFYVVTAYNLGPARLDDLLSRNAFKPVITRRYFEAIRRGIASFRIDRRIEAAKDQARGLGEV